MPRLRGLTILWIAALGLLSLAAITIQLWMHHGQPPWYLTSMTPGGRWMASKVQTDILWLAGLVSHFKLEIIGGLAVLCLGDWMSS